MKSIFYILIVTILLSCNDKKSEVSKGRELKTEFVQQLKKKYSTTHVWSTNVLDGKKYSIEFEEIVNSRVQLIQYFDIIDVFRKNHKVYLLVDADLEFIFELEIEEAMVSKVISLGEYSYTKSPCVLIVNIDYFRKPSITLNADIDFIEDEEPFAYMDYVSSTTFYGKGKLLGIECMK